MKGGVGEKKKNKRVTWLEGLSCLEEVQLVAEEALLEETVVDAGRGKKEKPSAGRKKREVDREEREACRGYSVAGEELGRWRRLGRSWSQHC